MATRQLPSPEVLRQLLRYEPETGKLFWKERPASMFTSLSLLNAWNRTYAGGEAFTNVKDGYRTGTILTRPIRAHRAAWAIHFGEWPKGEIDHINGVKDDNRITNLRDVSRSENMRNAGIRHDNASGHTGVRWDERTQRWQAEIKRNYRSIHLGRFATIEEAIAARQSAERDLGFHDNHGRRDSYRPHTGS